MKVSVIMAACNQGEWLSRTIGSAINGLRGARDWEIIVIDDHSTDNCIEIATKEHQEEKRVQFHRPEEKLGVSKARHLAGTMTTGDVIVTTDTHCEYGRRSLHRMSHWANRLRAIIMPTTQMQKDDKSFVHVEGGSLEICERGLRINRPRRARKHPALFGGMYVMRRDVWDTIGGWVELPGYWAGEEQINTLLAHRFGVPIVLLNKHEVKHFRYRTHNQYPYELPKHHPGEIAHYIHGSCFPSTYEEIWKPLISFYYNQNPVTDHIGMINWIERRSVYSESQVTKRLFGVDDLSKHVAVESAIKRLERMKARGH